jgi:hypothetical protein
MTSSSATVSTTAPADQIWDEAFIRVESYLRAHGLQSRLLLNQITIKVIEEAQASMARDPASEPVALAMQLTHGHGWLEQES